MSVRTTLARVFSSIVGKATEGAHRPGPYWLPHTQAWLSADGGQYWNFWQMGRDPASGPQSAMVEAAVGLYARTISSFPGAHWRRLDNGGRERVLNSALSRILLRPNDYQTPAEFMSDAVRSMLLQGNAFALCLRNARYEIDEMHLMDPRQCAPMVVTETGEIFYQLAGNAVIAARLAELSDQALVAEQLRVPMRDVLHLRGPAFAAALWPFPLVGQTALSAAEGDVLMAQRIRDQQELFYRNQARPSAVLTTDMSLSREQAAELRDRWNEQAKGLHQGGVPILSNGLKVQPWTSAPPAKDLQVAELLKMAGDTIPIVLGVPLPLLGVDRASGTRTAELMLQWRATALGPFVNAIEQRYDLMFGLATPGEFTELDTRPLMRMEPKEEIEYLVRAVQGGIFSPNEARAMQDLPAVPYGDEPRVQMQVVPLSAAAAIEPSASLGPAPAAPAPPPTGGPSAAPRSAPRIRSVARMTSAEIEQDIERRGREGVAKHRRGNGHDLSGEPWGNA